MIASGSSYKTQGLKRTIKLPNRRTVVLSIAISSSILAITGHVLRKTNGLLPPYSPTGDLIAKRTQSINPLFRSLSLSDDNGSLGEVYVLQKGVELKIYTPDNSPDIFNGSDPVEKVVVANAKKGERNLIAFVGSYSNGEPSPIGTFVENSEVINMSPEPKFGGLLVSKRYSACEVISSPTRENTLEVLAKTPKNCINQYYVYDRKNPNKARFPRNLVMIDKWRFIFNADSEDGSRIKGLIQFSRPMTLRDAIDSLEKIRIKLKEKPFCVSRALLTDAGSSQKGLVLDNGVKHTLGGTIPFKSFIGSKWPKNTDISNVLCFSKSSPESGM